MCLSSCLDAFFSPSAHKMINSSPLHFQTAFAGDAVVLPCSCHSVAAIEYHWFKQREGPSPQLVTKCLSLNDDGSFSEEFANSRFALVIKESNYQLKISNLTFSDSATYYCLAVRMQTSMFCEGTTLTVKGSGRNISASVYKSDTIQSAEPETVNCAIGTLICSEEQSVYWFGNTRENHPIYTQAGGDDQRLFKPKSKARVCEFNLPVERLKHSHDGTFYCAIATCGHIVFGDKTNKDIKSEWSRQTQEKIHWWNAQFCVSLCFYKPTSDGEDSLVLVYILGVASALAILLCVCLAVPVCLMMTTTVEVNDWPTFQGTKSACAK